MMNEPLTQELKAITDYLDMIDPQWRTKIAAKGAHGSMTVTTSDSMASPYARHDDVDGWVAPKDGPVNVRSDTRVDDSTYLYKLNDKALVKGSKKGGDGFTWYRISNSPDSYVREDVVIFTKDKPQPLIPINAALWPAPVTDYKVTNTHENERDHDGIDFMCPLGTPVRVGPNGGYVAKVFHCHHCKLTGDGATSLRDASKGYGYGSHVVIRYAYDILPQAVKAVIPQGAYLYAMHAHLSMIATVLKPGMTLDPYQKIGEVGSTGNSTGPHLHYALHWSMSAAADFYSIRANAIDPTLLVKA